MSQPVDAQQDLDAGLLIVYAFLAARGYAVMIELSTGDGTINFRLVQGRRRCSLLVRRETLLRLDLEELLADSGLADRLEEDAVVVLEGPPSSIGGPGNRCDIPVPEQ